MLRPSDSFISFHLIDLELQNECTKNPSIQTDGMGRDNVVCQKWCVIYAATCFCIMF